MQILTPSEGSHEHVELNCDSTAAEKWAYAHLLIKNSEMLERDSEKKTKKPQISPKLEPITFFLENDSFENCARQLRAHKKP